MASLRHRPVLHMNEETSPVLPTRKGHSQGSTQVSLPAQAVPLQVVCPPLGSVCITKVCRLPDLQHAHGVVW